MEEPLLHRTTTTTSPSSPTTSSIINRLLFLVLIALISIWANYEASKGFEVIILNNSGDTPQGRRFDLFFVSDDRATRIVLNTSKFVERILYPDHHHPKKPRRCNGPWHVCGCGRGTVELRRSWWVGWWSASP
ncbi:hypothetical protein AAC387_Pa12g2250 [Persea americana]